jgi:hypothetical protein
VVRWQRTSMKSRKLKRMSDMKTCESSGHAERQRKRTKAGTGSPFANSGLSQHQR